MRNVSLSPLRAQLPAFSPIAASVLLAPVSAAVGGSAALMQVQRRVMHHLGAREVLLLDSGTSALLVAIEAATDGGRLGPVALPAYCCYDVATAALGAGTPALLFDVDSETLSPDLQSVERCLSQGAAAVVVAHLYGVPVDVGALQRAVNGAGGVLIEDAAQAMGAAVGTKPAGASGDLSVLSFGRGKGLTGGGGGALVALSARGAALMGAARRRAGSAPLGVLKWAALIGQWLFGRPSLYRVPLGIRSLHLGETRFRSIWPPVEMPAMWASALLRTWDSSLAEVDVRRRHAGRLLGSIVTGRLREVRLHPAARASHLRLPLMADTQIAQAVEHGQGRLLGIARGYPKALCDLPQMRTGLAVGGGEWPGARALATGLVTLPTHSLLAERDLLALEQWVAGWGK